MKLKESFSKRNYSHLQRLTQKVENLDQMLMVESGLEPRDQESFHGDYVCNLPLPLNILSQNGD